MTLTNKSKARLRTATLLAALLLRVSVATSSALEVSKLPSPAPATNGQRNIHWSLQPLTSPAIPEVKNKAWPRNPIDHFILARLEKNGLPPSPPADVTTLIRRLNFDLLGLPPTPREIDRVLNDRSGRACENLIERLLASPHYGERWGRHWLDVARYTESDGFEYDKLRERAWPYRDYVINSFNHDKPYNQFILEQLAGDTLEPVSAESIIATSLLVCGSWDEAGSGQANVTQRMITREEEMEDLLSVIGQTFLGMTLNCARCHSHKFDPIPQSDYYRIKSVFDGVYHGERTIATPDEVKSREQRVTTLKERIAKTQTQLAQLDADGRQAALASRKVSCQQSAPGPVPFACWTFDGDARDSFGSLHGTLHGGASVTNGRLRLDGERAFLQTAPLERDLSEKTLEAWVSLTRLDQGGGAAIAIENKDGSVFDAIVFGERQSRKWVAGSSNFERTHDLDAPEETATSNELVHVAIVYRADNSIAAFRNGEPYGQPYTPGSGLQTFRAGEAHLLVGLRHSPAGAKKFLAAEIEQASLYDRALTREEVAASFASSGHSVSLDELLAALTPEQRSRREQWSQQLARDREELSTVPALPVAYVGTRKQPEPTHLLKRGDVKSPLEIVTPGALSAVAELSDDFGLPADAPEAQRRLKLAEWIADPKNPLTARVIANRVWHLHFGQGIVTTPNDLGASGAKPSHPELLDWLASQLIEHGWSLKHLHRLILNSATFRQSSAFNVAAAKVDADDQLLWRFPPRRLEAEALRDAMLAVSGQINLAHGGPSTRPFELVKFPTQAYVPLDKSGPEYDRRTVYRMNVNSGKDPMLDSFDCPDPSTKTPRRGTTTTPLQALALMNSSFVQRQAKHFAARVLKESKGDEPKAIRLAYRYCFGRAASPEEVARAIAVAKESSLQNVCWALLNATEFLYVR